MVDYKKKYLKYKKKYLNHKKGGSIGNWFVSNNASSVTSAQDTAEQEKKRLMQEKNIKSVTLKQEISFLNNLIFEKKTNIVINKNQLKLSTELLNDLKKKIIKQEKELVEKEKELEAKKQELKTNMEAISIGCDNKSN